MNPEDEATDEEEDDNPIFDRFTSRPYSAEETAKRLQRYRRSSPKLLKYLLQRERQKLHELNDHFPDVYAFKLSHPQWGRMVALETRIQLLNQVLDEREPQAVVPGAASEPEQEVSKPVSRREFIDSILNQKGWSLYDLAKETGVDYKTVWNCANGKTRRPYPRTLKLLANALGVDVRAIPN
jgi:lambda repressor-like predicted transcriptional regulator